MIKFELGLNPNEPTVQKLDIFPFFATKCEQCNNLELFEFSVSLD